jgi:hypothetical protein
MDAMPEKIEEELRSQLYSALIELSFALAEEKAAIVKRVYLASSALNDLIVNRGRPATT